MARDGNKNIVAGDRYLSLPYTAAAWFYIDDTETTNIFSRVVSELQNGNFAFHSFTCYCVNNGTTSEMGVRLQALGPGGGEFETLDIFTTAVSGWYHAAFQVLATNSRKVWFDGGTPTTSTKDIDPTFPAGDTDTNITVLSGLPIVEVGIWDVELTQAEIDQLASGVPCWKVRRADLINYVPFVGGVQDLVGESIWDTSNDNGDTGYNHCNKIFGVLGA